MPNCWKLLARQRQIPQEIPPMIRSFRFRMLDTVPSDESTKLLAFVAAVFGVLPNTSFSQNVGLVAMIKSEIRRYADAGTFHVTGCGCSGRVRL